ncbi:MAG TPA: 50S ribosomal protein L31e [archaeon]|nr:50S ribosomal protein L31e [archaeon]
MVEEKTEKIITINLRKGLKKSPRWNRARKVAANLRKIIARHFKAEEIKIDAKVNDAIWRRSIERPVHKLRLKVTKTDAKTAKVELLEK